MPFPIDNEWTVIHPTITRTNTMTSIDITVPTSAPEPAIQATVNEKPTVIEKGDAAECTCDASKPKLDRQDSINSINSIDDDYRNRRRVRPNYIRRYSVSPVRIRQPNLRDTASLISSSTQLLDKVSKYDGIVDLPFPARGSIYLTTFPFTDRDVKKWSWLFSLGVEDNFLVESGRGRLAENDSDGEDLAFPTVRPVRRGRDRSPFYDPGTIDIPSVFLSRALEVSVVPDDTEKIRYIIVTQNRHRPAGSKLILAESRKAAGMLMYYELLKGDSIMFVGATVYQGKQNVHPKKFKKVQTLEDAIHAEGEGFVGVVC
ncbi:hypothetical protein BKA66DRAFT_178006 [Pyrenochaeta sp. MPI-SDFR-AT-0127]|nr:hypothetical protein BKA66DRAFT_178006 [Pyrenochaeta sp. MPI-SDFR-AT-0127]